jgi:hypothetical protein
VDVFYRLLGGILLRAWQKNGPRFGRLPIIGPGTTSKGFEDRGSLIFWTYWLSSSCLCGGGSYLPLEVYSSGTKENFTVKSVFTAYTIAVKAVDSHAALVVSSFSDIDFGSLSFCELLADRRSILT